MKEDEVWEHIESLGQHELEREYVRLYTAMVATGLVRDKDHVAVRRDGLWHLTDCSFAFGFGDCDKRCHKAREALTFK
jgi:hypothetical protein